MGDKQIELISAAFEVWMLFTARCSKNFVQMIQVESFI